MRHIITPDVNVPGMTDFTARITKGESIWLTVSPFTLYIRKTEDGLTVEVFPEGKEDTTSLDDLWVLDQEAQESEE